MKDALLIVQACGVGFDLAAELAAGFFKFFAGGLHCKLVALLTGENLPFGGFDHAADRAVIPFERLLQLLACEPVPVSQKAK